MGTSDGEHPARDLAVAAGEVRGAALSDYAERAEPLARMIGTTLRKSVPVLAERIQRSGDAELAHAEDALATLESDARRQVATYAWALERAGILDARRLPAEIREADTVRAAAWPARGGDAWRNEWTRRSAGVAGLAGWRETLEAQIVAAAPTLLAQLAGVFPRGVAVSITDPGTGILPMELTYEWHDRDDRWRRGRRRAEGERWYQVGTATDIYDVERYQVADPRHGVGRFRDPGVPPHLAVDTLVIALNRRRITLPAGPLQTAGPYVIHARPARLMMGRDARFDSRPYQTVLLTQFLLDYPDIERLLRARPGVNATRGTTELIAVADVSEQVAAAVHAWRRIDRSLRAQVTTPRSRGESVVLVEGPSLEVERDPVVIEDQRVEARSPAVVMMEDQPVEALRAGVVERTAPPHMSESRDEMLARMRAERAAREAEACTRIRALRDRAYRGMVSASSDEGRAGQALYRHLMDLAASADTRGFGHYDPQAYGIPSGARIAVATESGARLDITIPDLDAPDQAIEMDLGYGSDWDPAAANDPSLYDPERIWSYAERISVSPSGDFEASKSRKATLGTPRHPIAGPGFEERPWDLGAAELLQRIAEAYAPAAEQDRGHARWDRDMANVSGWSDVAATRPSAAQPARRLHHGGTVL